MKNLKLTFFLVSILVIAIVWVRLERIKEGYTYQSIKKQKQKKLDEFYKLKLIYAEHVSPAKIAVKAKKLGLVKPSEKQFRYIMHIR